MDGIATFIKVIDALVDEGKTIKDLSEHIKIPIEDVTDMIKTIFKYGLDTYICIELYDSDMNEIESLEDFNGDIGSIEVVYYGEERDLMEVYKLNDLSQKERWITFNLLKECKGSFIESERSSILSSYANEFESYYEIISKRRIIKQVFDIFDISEEVVLKIYNSINEKRYINIALKNGKFLNNAVPIKFYYNDDLKKWYLEHRKKRNIEYIRFENIKDIEILDKIHKEDINTKYSWGFGNRITRVKLRVFNEKNAKELAIRFLSRKNIMFMKSYDEYFDMEVKVSDISLFKRWARMMAPYVVVISPESLRESMKMEIKTWIQNYSQK